MPIYDLSKNNPFDRAKFQEKVKEMLDKGEVVSLTRKSPQRSLAQNRYMYLLFGYFGSEYGVSVEEAKNDYFKALVNPELFVRYKTNRFGTMVRYLRSTAELTTSELTTAIDRFRNWSSSQFGLYLPSPEDRQMLVHAEKVIEANKEYI